MANLTKEEAAEIGLRAEGLSQEILKNLAEGKAQREVALTALQMAFAYVCVQMGVSFEDCMATLAQNMPMFYKKQFALQQGSPAPVIDLSEARNKDK